MLILECSQGCYGRTDGSVTICHHNFVGEGIKKLIFLMETIVFGFKYIKNILLQQFIIYFGQILIHLKLQFLKIVHTRRQPISFSPQPDDDMAFIYVIMYNIAVFNSKISVICQLLYLMIKISNNVPFIRTLIGYYTVLYTIYFHIVHNTV